MDSNRWKKIWDSRSASPAAINTLERLIRLDGFDTGAGAVEVADWEMYAKRIAENLGIKAGDSLYEVGCGSGAFLYPFWQSGHRVGGLDYSPVLIEEACKTMGSDFICREAVALEEEPLYDVVFSNSVFQYFSTLAYAEAVIARMIKKAKKSIAVLDVPNKALEMEAENVRRGKLSPNEYDQKYKDLPRLYYSKEWFEELGAHYGAEVEISRQEIQGYGNSPFNFNVVMRV
ncbi:class I SAM-dependent methyltransferase [Candidatus Uhrbacteria bacterium]|nr:class I SAM-dependent methyltransferase [Candidatus Uhrbacteria bacterium]